MTNTTETTAAITESPKPLSLFQAENLLTKLENVLSASTEDTDEIDNTELEQLAQQYLEASNSALDAIERYCVIIHRFAKRAKVREATVKVWREETNELATLAKQDLSLVDRLKGRLLAFMDGKGTAKIETNHFKLSTRNNGGKEPLVIDENYSMRDAATFYPNLIRFELDKEAIRTFLEAGGELPFARLGARGRSLVIKP